MKKNRIFGMLSGIGLLLAAGACSNEVLDPGKEPGKLTPGDQGGVYMAVDFEMPDGSSGTRSETTGDGGSTGGTEIGSEEENYVTSALIVLAATEAHGEDVQEYGFIAAGEVQNNRIAFLTEKNTKQYRATASIQKENLNTYYGYYWDEATQSYNLPSVYVFVFCNPTKQLLELFETGVIAKDENGQAGEAGGNGEAGDGNEEETTEKGLFGTSDWINTICRVTQGKEGAADFNVGIWSANSFLMNNVRLAKRLLPKSLLDWELFTSVDNPFHLSDNNTVAGLSAVVNNSNENEDGTPKEGGSVLVERSVARFDFKDGSVGQNKDNTPNTYDVLFLSNKDGNDDEANPIVQVELQKMCLVNMSNAFYFLPRVSPNGMATEITLLGAQKKWTRETNGSYKGGNYVVGPYASIFGSEKDVTTGFSTYFNYPFFDDNGSFSNATMNSKRWDVVKIENVLKGRDDNYTGTDNTEDPKNEDGTSKKVTHTPGDYKVWRYVTENVIPGRKNQQNGISTGIIFKGKMEGTSIAESGKDATNKENDLYEEDWNKGFVQNLANCLNGKTFIFDNVDHEKLKGSPSDDPILYYFNGKLYMGWRHIRQAAIQASISENVNGTLEINRSNSLYKAVFGDGPIPPIPASKVGDKEIPEHPNYYMTGKETYKEIVDPRWTECKDKPESADYQNYLKSANYAWTQWADNGRESGNDASDAAGETVPETLKKMRKAVTDAGIYIYQSSYDEDYGAGYYCYYYYWNRHNDNNINGTMGPMEFDVVRNNVYKLSVDQIKRLGHPRIPENDPNNPKPEDPDESDEIYLDVRVQIAPWAVRVNKIVF